MYTTNYDTVSGVFAAFGVMIFFLLFLILVFGIVLIIAKWKLFKKAGKHGWEAIIPFYSTWVLIEIAGLNWWYFLISISGTIFSVLDIKSLGLLSSLASLFVNFLVFYNLAKKTKQNEKLYGILSIFFSGILVMILGFSKKITFDNTVSVGPNGPINEPKNDSMPAAEEKYCLGCGHKLTSDVLYCENCGKKVEN